MFHAAKICAACLLAFLAVERAARAQVDGGCAEDAGICQEVGGLDGGNPNDGGVPLACDGALCDTTNGASCSSVGAPANLAWLAIVTAAFAWPILRRRRRLLGGSASKLAACAAFAFAAATSGVALAEPPPGVDAVIREEPPPRRTLTIEFNPLPAILGKLSANLIITPVSHHALVLSPSYVSVETAPIYIFDDAGQATQLPKQKFSGWGGELGYRYYLGERGPRGFFLGPSFMLSSLIAEAQDGSKTRFLNRGVAADIGYQALLWDNVALTLGGGVQYTKTDKPIPDQQFPAKLFANGGVRPRLLLSVGWAF